MNYEKGTQAALAFFMNASQPDFIFHLSNFICRFKLATILVSFGAGLNSKSAFFCGGN